MRIENTVTKSKMIKAIMLFCQDCSEDYLNCPGRFDHSPDCELFEVRNLTYDNADPIDIPSKIRLRDAIRESCIWCKGTMFSKIVSCDSTTCPFRTLNVVTPAPHFGRRQ